MRVSHVSRSAAWSFDEPNLVSAAGLLPLVRLAESAGLRRLADEWLTVSTDKGANAGLNVASLVAGMVAGADSIYDMSVLRHGRMGKIFSQVYAPSTLGSFLRSFTFGHVRQLHAVASRLLKGLASQAHLVPAPAEGGLLFVDVDDTIIEVFGPKKAGRGIRILRGRELALSLANGAMWIPRRRLSGAPRLARCLCSPHLW